MTALRTLVIGGGQAGLAAAFAFKRRGLPFEAVEAEDDVGGLWRFGSAASIAYRTLRMNSSKRTSVFANFPYPASVPDFPSHDQVFAYLRSFAEQRGLLDHYRFRLGVTAVERTDDVWTVRFTDGTTGRYGNVVVATGHNRIPRRMNPTGFTGHILHSADYRDPEQLTARRVLVVGAGPSAADIACDAVARSDSVVVSVRRMPVVVPRYLLGRPVDHWNTSAPSRLPVFVRRQLYKGLLRIGGVRQTRFGLPKAQQPILSGYPTVSTEFLNFIRAGRIRVKPGIHRADGSTVTFMDETSEPFDLIVEATGCVPHFPFLPAGIVPGPLHRHVVPPDHPGLFLIGYFTALGVTLPVAEAQAEWVGDIVAGTKRLPYRAAMFAEIDRTTAERSRVYRSEPSERPLIDPFPYIRSLSRSD